MREGARGTNLGQRLLHFGSEHFLTETGLFFAFDFIVVMIMLHNDTNEVTNRDCAAMAGVNDDGGGGDGSGLVELQAGADVLHAALWAQDWC